MSGLISAAARRVRVPGSGASLADWWFGALGDGADPTGAASARAVLVAEDAACVAAGRPLHIPPGIYLVDVNTTFSAPVIMSPGARLKVTDAAVYVKFAGGFESGLYYCLDVAGPTQFLKTDAIYPEWFGAMGTTGADDTVALTRAFKACRAGTNAATPVPDSSYGCTTVRLQSSGYYRHNDVPVYCGTTIEGEWAGSLAGGALVQVDYTKPGLRFVPKNYSLAGVVINDGNGQNTIRHVKFYSEVAASGSEGKPPCYFMSPAQATAYLGIAGDTTGAVGHIDTQFHGCWFLATNTAIMADDGMLWVHLRGNTFDVCRRAVQHTGQAKGMVRSYGNVYYACTWGALDNTSSEATTGVKWESIGDEFKAGNTQNANASYRRALNYNPGAYVAGTFVRVKGSHFLRTDLSGSRFGGPVFVKNCEAVDIDCRMVDPDCNNNQKAIAIQDNVRHLSIRGDIVTSDLASYVNARMVSITQAAQTLSDCHLAVNITNMNATAVATAVHSDYALTGVDLSGTVVNGAFTVRADPLITRPYGWVCTGGKVYDPPSIAAAGQASTTVTVTGARLGDDASVVFSASLGGLIASAYVSASDTVTVVLFNPTGSAIDLASGTISASTQRRA